MGEPVRYLSCGDTALVVEFGDSVDPDLNARVMHLDAALRDDPPGGLVETVPTFRSLMIHYDPCRTSRATLETVVSERLAHEAAVEEMPRLWRLPVCYEGEHAPDMESVVERTGRSRDEVVAIHTGALFRVYMLGFLPGLPYLAGMDERLSLPRLKEPRVRVPARAVGIAGTMSVIYPLVSPGGWNLIGRTPVPMFDLAREPAILFAPGDRVRFEAIDAAAYDALEEQVAAGGLEPASLLGDTAEASR